MVTSRIVYGQDDYRIVKSRDTHLVLLVSSPSHFPQTFICDLGQGDSMTKEPLLLNDGALVDGPAGRKIWLFLKENGWWVYEVMEKGSWKPFYVFQQDAVRDEKYFQEMLDFVSIPSNNSAPLCGKFCCRAWPDLSQIVIYGDFVGKDAKGVTVVRLDGEGKLVEKLTILDEPAFRDLMLTYFQIDILQIKI